MSGAGSEIHWATTRVEHAILSEVDARPSRSLPPSGGSRSLIDHTAHASPDTS